MRTITVNTFIKNIRKYAVLANEEKILVNREKGKLFLIIPIENIEYKGYTIDFVKRILAYKDEVKKGKVKKVNNINNI